MMTSDLSKVSHIIFDWDGTIMDSAGKIVNCMQKTAKKANLPIPTDKQVEHIIGISLLPAVQQLFGISVTKAQEVCGYYKQIFIEQDQTPCPLFAGAHELLSVLAQNYTLGVATGKARRGLHRAFDSTNSAAYFSDSRCADEAASKPSPDMLLQLLNKWQIEPYQAVMIGDTVYDMQMAEAIAMPRIGVSYGVHDKQAILQHNPVHIVDDLSALHAIFIDSN
ncbi:MAG: phosphoglycolate phosphatase [Gammaproteobacteria bacterium]|jgi:phosphoglycolate phosphatase